MPIATQNYQLNETDTESEPEIESNNTIPEIELLYMITTFYMITYYIIFFYFLGFLLTGTENIILGFEFSIISIIICIFLYLPIYFIK